MALSATLVAMRETNPARARYAESLIDSVEHASYLRGAEVACVAVRGIVSCGSDEWAILVETFGEPAADDWWMAQAVYGPNYGLPGTVRWHV